MTPGSVSGVYPSSASRATSASSYGQTAKPSKAAAQNRASAAGAAQSTTTCFKRATNQSSRSQAEEPTNAGVQRA